MAANPRESDPRPQSRQLPLNALAHQLGVDAVFGDVWIQGITHDSRRVEPGNLYAALAGENFHGAQFAAEAAKAGAQAILTDVAGRDLIDGLVAQGQSVANLPLVVVGNPRAVLGQTAAWIYDYPARDLVMVGITGTDGKTTTAMLIEGALNSLGVSTGLVGTIATRVGDWSSASARTTPEASDLQALLAIMRDKGAKAAVLEVSSHALELGRADSIVFDIAVFTNLGLDHLDFHGTQENYFKAKAKLFTPERTKRAVICASDSWGVRLLESTEVPSEAYVVGGIQVAQWATDDSGQREKTWFARDLELTASGLQFELDAAGIGARATPYQASTRLFGRYNVANATAAIAVASRVLAQTEDEENPTESTIDQAIKAVAVSSGAPGRMESVDAGQDFTMLVDYAHTPDAVENALENVSELAESTGAKVICVLGCGGDRDPSKRPTMGQIAVQNADIVVVTDDNPRSEDPSVIRRAILDGIDQLEGEHRAKLVEEVSDRREAVRIAVSMAQTNDVVIALGKGHEPGQEVNGEVLPMDDRELLASSFADQY